MILLEAPPSSVSPLGNAGNIDENDKGCFGNKELEPGFISIIQQCFNAWSNQAMEMAIHCLMEA